MGPFGAFCHYFVIKFSLFVVVFQMAQSALAESSNHTPQNILDAIAICRQKLSDDPHFPKVQHSLAQLLDSQLSHVYDTPSKVSQPDRDRLLEVLQLYHAVGQPPLEVEEKRRPPPKIRYEALVRAGTIARDTLYHTRQAITSFLLAMGIEGIDDLSLIAVFEQVMPLLLSKEATLEDATIEVDSSFGADLQSIVGSEQHLQNYIQTALGLCKVLSVKCPNETIVDEYKGATLRRMRQPQLAYQSYRDAMFKAKQQCLDCLSANADEHHCILASINFLRTSVLAAAAGGEAGVDPDQQLNYLSEAETLVASSNVLTSLRTSNSHGDGMKDALIEQLVDLHINCGIIEKKRESWDQAFAYFNKAIALNPNDGHALVQLASIEGKTSRGNYDAVSDVKALDPNYVSALFDGYSSRFESELVDVLQYRGHLLVHDAMKTALAQMNRPLSSIQQIAELGCGTGLLGDIVAREIPWSELHGVDISARMVEISRERKTATGKNVYSDVINGDALQYLSTLGRKSCDCILASDVFIYIGDVSLVLNAASKCLVDSGIVVFTVESCDNDSSASGMRLLKSGRFGHSKKYIENVSGKNGFKVLTWTDCVLRQQGGIDVKGAVVVLMKI